MAVAAHLKSMDLLMFARASEGLTHVRGMVVSFLAFVCGGAFPVLGSYVASASMNVLARMFLLFTWFLYALIAGTGVSANGGAGTGNGVAVDALRGRRASGPPDGHQSRLSRRFRRRR